MAGTREGGIKAAAANKKLNPDFYRLIGRKGGLISRNREWLESEEGKRALSEAGRKGGLISRRPKQ